MRNGEVKNLTRRIVSADGESLFEGRYRALLFDMDGTVLDSTASAERVWGAWAIDHGLDVETFLPTIHGARTVDRISSLQLPGVNQEVKAQRIPEGEIIASAGLEKISV